MPDSSSQSWVLFAILSALFAGLTAIFGKVGVEDINSNLATFIRTVVVLVIVAGIVSLQQQWLPVNKISYRSLLFLTLSGIATGLSWLCYWRAMQLGKASAVNVIDKFSLVVVIVLAWVFLREIITWRIALGGALVTVGMIVIALAPKPGKPADGPGTRASPPASQVTPSHDVPLPPNTNATRP